MVTKWMQKGKAKDAFGQLEKRILRVVAKKKEWENALINVFFSISLVATQTSNGQTGLKDEKWSGF
jgi:hypothetical protein